jgi:Fur family zinc uptake transcriptional regulator
MLGFILDAASPPGAYELLDRICQTRRGAAPPTVYRTLSFLVDQGLIHNIERLSAFIGCVAGCTAAPGAEMYHHAAQFLICRGCRQVVELRNQDVSMVFARAAKEVGFSVSDVAIEMEGLCYTCKSGAAMAQRSNV